MPVQRFQAFISYTSELKTECEAVVQACHELSVVPFDYQKVAANGDSPREYVERELIRSDIYLGILGGRHGSVYPPPPDRSVVEFEFENFRAHPGLRLTALFHKVLPPEDIEPLQARFRSKTTGFESKVWRRDFDSIDRLCAEVKKAINAWLINRALPLAQEEERHRQKWRPVITALAAVFGALVVITAFVSLALPSILPRDVALMIVGCEGTAIIMSFFFLLFVL